MSCFPRDCWAVRDRRDVAERLRTELLGGEPEEWLPRLAEAAFHRRDLFEALLEICHAALPFDPRRAYEVSEVALELGRRLRELVPEIASVESFGRALCLGSHARRLLGDHPGAEALLESAAVLPLDPAERGFFCRAMALLRWDEGRFEEAASLLSQASRRYQELGDAREEGICLALMGFLRTAKGEMRQGEAFLRKSMETLDPQSRPRLVAEARLTLALGLARTDRKAEAQYLWQEAWSLYSQIPNPDALFSLVWREGQVAYALGDWAQRL
ncbi:MAG TPA: hypothetical protein VF173_04200 [Thermoanaerobaculia bacterium]|nr:hypothetical protein [Thermoanaerobaculia bacterium]